MNVDGTTGVIAARLPFRGTRLSSGAISVLLLAVGLFAATYAVWRYDRAMPTDSVVLMGSRAAGVQAAIDVMKDGGPPLTGRAAPTEGQGAGASETLYPADRGDDPGIYLYLPVLGQILGIDDPLQLLKLFFLGLMGLAIAVTPRCDVPRDRFDCRGIDRRCACAWRVHFRRRTPTSYWIGAWCYLLAIPLLLAALRQRNRTVTFIPPRRGVTRCELCLFHPEPGRTSDHHLGLGDRVRQISRRAHDYTSLAWLRTRRRLSGHLERRDRFGPRVSRSSNRRLHLCGEFVGPSLLAHAVPRIGLHRQPVWHRLQRPGRDECGRGCEPRWP